jgi:hypothetical protein
MTVDKVIGRMAAKSWGRTKGDSKRIASKAARRAAKVRANKGLRPASCTS